MTSRERFARMYAHQEADRVPIIDQPWAGTIARWKREGMPENCDWRDYFGVDKVASIGADNSPRWPYVKTQETDTTVTYRTNWGVTLQYLKGVDSSPRFLDYTVTDRAAWEDAKKRMYAGDDDERIDWKGLENGYDLWRADGCWIEAGFWFGFDVTHSWMMGTENLLIAMYEDPDMVTDMFASYLDRHMTLFGKIWDRGYRFDSIYWPDDMGYKDRTFFSEEMYRELLMPYHKKAIDWAHERGVYAHLHSCGNIMSRVPTLVSIGLDALNPLEVKAGMDPLKLKREYGDRLTLHGGVNAVLWDDREAIVEEIRRVVPVLKENGGYIFSSDHSIPNSVSLENFRAIVQEVKTCGAYD